MTIDSIDREQQAADSESLFLEGERRLEKVTEAFATHEEAPLVLLLDTCDRALSRLGVTPEGRARPLYHELELIRDRFAEQLAVLRRGAAFAQRALVLEEEAMNRIPRSPRMASGTVKWFNDPSGYGYITPDEGGKDLFVHRGSIVGDWRTTALTEGARVDFKRRQGGMGPEAINVTCDSTAGERPRPNLNG